MELRRPKTPAPLEDVKRALKLAAKPPRTKYGKKRALVEVRKAREYLDAHRDDLTVDMALAPNRSTARVDFMLAKLSKFETTLKDAK